MRLRRSRQRLHRLGAADADVDEDQRQHADGARRGVIVGRVRRTGRRRERQDDQNGGNGHRRGGRACTGCTAARVGARPARPSANSRRAAAAMPPTLRRSSWWPRRDRAAGRAARGVAQGQIVERRVERANPGCRADHSRPLRNRRRTRRRPREEHRGQQRDRDVAARIDGLLAERGRALEAGEAQDAEHHAEAQAGPAVEAADG